MLKAIQDFFEQRIRPSDRSDAGSDPEHQVKLATAALLVEMQRADYDEQAAEREAIGANLADFFELDTREVEQLVKLAEQEADEGVSLFQFTTCIDREFPIERKRRVVEMLWRVSMADGHRDMHEEHLVRKVAHLLHVPHQDFVQARIRVENALAREGR